MGNRTMYAALCAALAINLPALPASAQVSAVSEADGIHAGELMVPVNKSQVLRVDRPYAKALIGNPEVADVLPLTSQSLYVLGKKLGTTSLTIYDRSNSLIAVVDVAVGPDVTGLKRQLGELMPDEQIGARISNDSIVLEGIVPNGPAADRAVQLAETYAPGKVVNLLAVGSSQQVMLEVKFSEVSRTALKDIGVSSFIGNNSVVGSGAGLSGAGPTLEPFTDRFGVLRGRFGIFGVNFDAFFDALESKGLITTLAEPNLVALSGETASFLAGGEFPIPVARDRTEGGTTITIEFKPFGVSLAFTPTVLADGVINLVVAPEVSSIDPNASIIINDFRIPGLRTRRAKTTVELRDGESFAMAGLLRKDFQDTVRQFPILGSIPIIGTLFRSTNFQRDDSELLMIVTPRLVKPVRANAFKLPTDRVKPPNEADLFLLGRTDTAVPAGPSLLRRTPTPPPPYEAPALPGGAAQTRPPSGPTGLERDYGHEL